MTGTDNPPESARGGSPGCRMIVRSAEEVDVEPLTAMWFEGWHDAHASIVPASLVRLRTRESFRQRLRFELDFVRLIGAPGAPLGFTMIREQLYQFYVGVSVRGTAHRRDADERRGGTNGGVRREHRVAGVCGRQHAGSAVL